MSQASPEPLTPRETIVLELLRSGLSNKLIARSISISDQTVKYHLKNIYNKLGATCRTHAVAIVSQGPSGSAPGPGVDGERAEEERQGIELPLTPLAFARRTRKLFPQHEAVVDQDRRLSYGEFFDRCDRASAVLAALGVRPGDRVATIAESTQVHLEQFYAIPQLGAVIVPINHRLIGEDFAYLIRHSGARIVCASSAYFDLIDGVRGALGEVQHFVALEGPRENWLDYESLMANSDGRYPAHEIGENDLIAINYTSGTGDKPRGVMLTHRNIWLSVTGQLLHWPLRAGDRYLWLLPLFHGNGWGFVWTVTAAAATHVCVRDFDTHALVRLMKRERVSALCAGKTALIGISNLSAELQGQLPAGVRVLTAGASPAAATIERVESLVGWEVTHAYGLTETSPFIAICDLAPAHAQHAPAERARFKARQGAELLTSGELRVIDEEGDEVPCDGETLGEVVVRGGVVMKGYYADPEATARAFAGGWFHTGDAAVMHADRHIEIRDRFKDIIISGDQIVSSIEVEQALMRHPAIHEVAVVGLPDAELGEAVHAFVVFNPGKRPSQDELLAPVRAHLAAFKLPSVIHAVAALPKTATGKVLKQVLRRQAYSQE